MDALESGVAHQGLLVRAARVGEGEGVEQGDAVAHDQHHHQPFEYRLSQVDLRGWIESTLLEDHQLG